MAVYAWYADESAKRKKTAVHAMDGPSGNKGVLKRPNSKTRTGSKTHVEICAGVYGAVNPLMRRGRSGSIWFSQTNRQTAFNGFKWISGEELLLLVESGQPVSSICVVCCSRLEVKFLAVASTE